MEINNEMEIKKKGNTWMKIALFVTLVGALASIISLFSPYTTATENYKIVLENDPDEMYLEELDITYKDAVNLSLVDYFRIYSYSLKEGLRTDVSGVCVMIIFLYAAFSVVTLICTILKKPVVILIFGVLAMIMYRLINLNFIERRIIPTNYFEWSRFNNLGYIAATIVIIGAIIMMIARRREKKCNNDGIKTERAESSE